MTDRAAADPSSTASVTPIVGAVLCGGRSSRFGSDKALADAGDTTVGRRVVAALRGAGIDPVVAVGGTAGPAIGVPTVPDLRPGQGPLGGLATALLWAKTGSVVVVACDLVLLQPDDVAELVAHEPSSPGRAVVATVGGEPQVTLARWPAAAGRRILALVDDGHRAFHRALDHLGWDGVELSPGAVADADTPEELRRLLGGGRQAGTEQS